MELRHSAMFGGWLVHNQPAVTLSWDGGLGMQVDVDP